VHVDIPPVAQLFDPEHSLISIFYENRNYAPTKKKERKKERKKGFSKEIIPVQLTPFPEYPVLQVQVRLPTVLAHVARVA